MLKPDNENINALKIIVFVPVSPGLLVRIYLQKFSVIKICINKIR